MSENWKEEYLNLVLNGAHDKITGFYIDKMLELKKLYKYIPLFDKDDKKIDYEKENNNRINIIAENKIWLSTFETMNDPFEFLGFYCTDAEKEITEQVITPVFEFLKREEVLSCFCATSPENMPLWAHYSNNHKGFCIEYEISDILAFVSSIHPVVYVDNRIEISIDKFQKILSDLFKRNISQVDYMMYLLASVKHSFWKYENEYRLIHMPAVHDYNQGLALDIKQFGLGVKKFMQGINVQTKIPNF